MTGQVKAAAEPCLRSRRTPIGHARPHRAPYPKCCRLPAAARQQSGVHGSRLFVLLAASGGVGSKQT